MLCPHGAMCGNPAFDPNYCPSPTRKEGGNQGGRSLYQEGSKGEREEGFGWLHGWPQEDEEKEEKEELEEEKEVEAEGEEEAGEEEVSDD